MASVAAINNLGSFANNPRGNIWFNDESTYGHKLLMKMGWNKGKGLGKNEDGITENLKVKFRSASSGLGYKDDAHANVMKSEYESILKNLSSKLNHSKVSDDKQPAEKNDCLPKTRVVTGKIRYPKLFFGKDVSKYSDKDMKSIFICGQLCKDNENEEKNFPVSSEKESESKTLLSGDTYKSEVSISEYFAKKMKEKKNLPSKNMKGEKEFQQVGLKSENLNSESMAITSKISSKRKRKSVDEDIDEESVYNVNSKEIQIKSKPVDEENITELLSKKSSKKKKKNSKASMIEVNFQSSEINGLKEEPEDINELIPVKNISSENANSDLNSNVGNVVGDSICRPSKKRKKFHENLNESGIFNDSKILSRSACEVKPLSVSPRKKKKCKGEKKDSEYTAEHFTESSVPDKTEHLKKSGEFLNGYHTSESSKAKISSNNEISSKKKKKLKKMLKQKLKSCLKNKSKSYSIKNVSFNETVSFQIIDSNLDSENHLGAKENMIKDGSSCELVEDNHCNDNLFQPFNSDEEKNSNHSVSDVQENTIEELQDDFSVSLPSSKSPHYNSWTESQRHALKMRIYKNFLKNIKQHDIFSTTNLLSIKGYGNWGFK